VIPISDTSKAIAQYTATAFGADRPPIRHMWDEARQSDLYVCEAVDCPQKGVTSYGTVGLSEYPLMRNGQEFGARVELVGACGSAFPGFNELLATLGFHVANSRWFCAPGVIFPGVMDLHRLSVTMRDVYFARPFLWGDHFGSAVFGERTVAWLLAVPVSRAESEYAIQKGPAQLEELFTARDIDIFNLNRASVV